MLLHAILLLQQGPTLAPEGPLSWLPGAPAEKTMVISGRLQSDWTFTAGGEDTEAALGEDIEDGHEFRRLRLGVGGNFTSDVKYRAEFDFAGGSAAVTDAYLEWVGWGVGDVKLGHFKEPFGIEELTSSRFSTFIERSAVSDAFAPARNVGLGLSDGGDSMNWGAGLFREADKTGKTTNEAYSATGRFVYRPWFADGGKSLLHLGVAASWRNPDGTVEYEAAPENHFIPVYYTTPAMMVDSTILLGVEVAFQEGPFHGQLEWQTADNSAPTGGTDTSYDGISVQGGWFITGESRGYKPEAGAWDRVKPEVNAGSDGGLGAWELAARFSTLDLTEGGAADDMDIISLAVNWYLNDYTRVMFDVMKPELADADDLTIFALRAAFDF